MLFRTPDYIMELGLPGFFYGPAWAEARATIAHVIVIARALSLVAVAVVAAAAAAQEGGARPLVEGRVTSAVDGAPLAGAVVVVRSWFDVVGSHRVGAAPVVPLQELRTDSEGRYAVPGVEGDQGPVLTVRVPGHATVTWRADRSRPDGPVPRRDVELRAAGAFVGTVFDSAGKPVPGARVFAVERDALEIEDHPTSAAAAADLLWGGGRYDDAIAYRCVEAVADGRGRFAIADADPAVLYVLVAAAPGTGPAFHPHAVGPAAGAPRRIDLHLPRPVRLSVRIVTPRAEPLAVPDARLAAFPVATSWEKTGPGTYELAPAVPGHHVLVLDTTERGQVHHAFRVPRGKETHAVEVRLGLGLAVTGAVVDGEGAPVEGARVNVQVWNPATGRSASTNVRTDADGMFESWGHPRGKTLVYVLKDGYQTAGLELEAPAQALVVRLQRARDVRVRVDPPEGHPRGPFIHCATQAGGAAWSKHRIRWGGDAPAPVLLEGVPVGRTVLRLWAPGCALWERELDVPAGDGALDLGAAQLEPARTLTVRIVDEQGKPLPGLKVHATIGDLPPVDWTEIEKTTDSGGRAVVELHAPGPPRIYVEEGGGRQRVHRTIEMPADPETVVDVPAGARVR